MSVIALRDDGGVLQGKGVLVGDRGGVIGCADRVCRKGVLIECVARVCVIGCVASVY